jgi:hypothetical protein
LFIEQLGSLETLPPFNPLKMDIEALLSGLTSIKAFTIMPEEDELQVHAFRTIFNIVYATR